MKRAVGFMLLAVLMVWGCETANSHSVTGRATTCAMCGASVGPDYFLYTQDRAFGPTNR